MQVVFDAEFDDINPTKLWCLVAVDVETEKEYVFSILNDPRWKKLKSFTRSVSSWIGANSVSFDAPSLSRLGIVDLPVEYPEAIDLQVVSRLINYNRAGGHSVDAYGKSYGVPKPVIVDFNNPELIDTYIHRCREDVRIQLQMYKELKRFIEAPEWQPSIAVEHYTLLVCDSIKGRGFAFDKPKAEHLLHLIEGQMASIEYRMHETIPPILKVGKEKVLRRKADGEPYLHTATFLGDPLPNFTDGSVVTPFEFEPFNPGSHKQRIDVLRRAGWKPIEKTKTHIKTLRLRKSPERDAKLEELGIYGWRVNETNIATLPKDAPEGAKLLAEWLTLDGRRGDLEEWLAAYNPDTGALHPTLFHIGAWTHRKSHSRPNCGNIFGAFDISMAKDPDDPTPVEAVKVYYNNDLRSTWIARPDHLLVGTDADSIQLRILAHAMDDPDYARAVSEGDKALGTDVHNVNRRALGLEWITRDDSKTFIYAWVLGAAYDKVKEILKCTTAQARTAVGTFLESIPSLRILREERIPFLAERGYFDGLDGRKVLCNSEHLMLAGILQNGESVVMKHANRLWRKEADAEGIPFFQVNDVHDEWQTEVPIVSRLQLDDEGRPFTAETKRLGEIQRESIRRVGEELGVLTPLAGTTKVGYNWYETH